MVRAAYPIVKLGYLIDFACNLLIQNEIEAPHCT
jgi:hypothetical protein